MIDTAAVLAGLRELVDYDEEGRWSAFLYDERDGVAWPPELAGVAAELHACAPWADCVVTQAYRDGDAFVPEHVDSWYQRQAVLSIGAPRTLTIRGRAHLLLDGTMIDVDPETPHGVPPMPGAGERYSIVFRKR